MLSNSTVTAATRFTKRGDRIVPPFCHNGKEINNHGTSPKFQASEFENTLEFHVQRCEHLEKLSLHNNKADSLQSVRGGVDSVLKEMRYRGK